MNAKPLGGRRELPPGWKLVVLDDIKSSDPNSCRAGPFGSNIGRKYFVDSGVPVIRGNNLSTDLVPFIAENFVFVTEQRTRENFMSCVTRPGDLVFTCWGTIGQVGRIPEQGPFDKYVISNKQLKLRTDPLIADSKFVYYYIASKEGVEYIKSCSIGAAVPGINLGIMKSIPIALPPLAVQNSIVGILSAYDDLIENNRRRIQLLEQSARLLYKEWFVHLRFPGHEHVPVVDGVPEGWERRPLGECAKFLSGGTPSKAKPEFWEGEIPWVSSGELRTMRIHRTKLNVTSAAINSGSRLVPKGTILAVVRGMSLAKEFRIGITARPVSFNQDIKALIGIDEIDTIFLFHAIDSQKDRIRDLSGDASHGTKKIDTPVLFAIPILAPPPTVQAAFRQIIAKIHDQWDILDNTNVGLQEARDLLLPRLMNGEIPV